MLTARQVADDGGDTEFANPYTAYAALPEERKAELAKYRVVHSVAASQLLFNPGASEKDREAWNRAPSREHPLVWRRRDGRNSLLIGATAGEIVGMSPENGPASADDLTQETFLRAIKSLPRFSGRSTAKTWLMSIARRVVVDQIRYNTSRPRPAYVLDLDDVLGARRGGDRIEAMVEIRMLLDGLDADRREALVLTQVLGLTYAEAAEVSGCPIGTIRSRVARARDDLLRAANEEKARDSSPMWPGRIRGRG